MVDGPRDLEWEMAARVVGKEIFEVLAGGSGSVRSTVEEVVRCALESVGRKGKEVGSSDRLEGVWEGLRENTRESVVKVLRYRSNEQVGEFVRRSAAYAVSVVGVPIAKGLRS